jgi:hypothetical protein
LNSHKQTKENAPTVASIAIAKTVAHAKPAATNNCLKARPAPAIAPRVHGRKAKAIWRQTVTRARKGRG